MKIFGGFNFHLYFYCVSFKNFSTMHGQYLVIIFRLLQWGGQVPIPRTIQHVTYICIWRFSKINLLTIKVYKKKAHINCLTVKQRGEKVIFWNHIHLKGNIGNVLSIYQCWLVISRRKPNWSLQCNHEQDIQFNFLISTNNKVQQYLNIWIPTGIQKCLINLFSLFGYNHAIIFTQRHLTIMLRFYFVSYRKILLPVTFLKIQVVSHNPNQIIC